MEREDRQSAGRQLDPHSHPALFVLCLGLRVNPAKQHWSLNDRNKNKMEKVQESVGEKEPGDERKVTAQSVQQLLWL